MSENFYSIQGKHIASYLMPIYPSQQKSRVFQGAKCNFSDFAEKSPISSISLRISKSNPENLFIFGIFPTYLHGSPQSSNRRGNATFICDNFDSPGCT